MFTGSDSLVYEIKTEDAYEDFYETKNLFDFSDYPPHSKFFDLVNKKVNGKMKNEFKGKIICGFVGVNSKMYSLIAVANEENKEVKGFNKKIRNKEFLDVLFNKKIMRRKMEITQSKVHRIGTYDVGKISLSCFEDKRYILDDCINSLAYFRKDVTSQ